MYSFYALLKPDLGGSGQFKPHEQVLVITAQQPDEMAVVLRATPPPTPPLTHPLSPHPT